MPMLLLGFLLSAIVAAAAWPLRLLTPGGAAAAVVVGTLVFGFGGWMHALLLVTFFGTSGLLTRWRREQKDHPEHPRGRTGAQVLANGLVASVLAVWGAAVPSQGILTAFAAAVATATADTWATEVGMLSRTAPRLITTWRTVAPGSSGAITPLGTAAGTLGGAVIAALAWGFLGGAFWQIWLAAVAAMFLDSVLGATIEQQVRFVDNNAVNLVATAAGAALALAGIPA